jgi:hypothetical protein
MTSRSVAPLAALALGLFACDKTSPPAEQSAPAAGSATTVPTSAGGTSA